MSDHREAIAEVLAGHAADTSDEQMIDGEWTWGINCDCGEFVPGSEVNAHLADALLGSDVLAQIRAEARAEALREAAEFIEVTAGIGTNDSTYANGWYAALGYALDELRDRAEGSA